MIHPTDGSVFESLGFLLGVGVIVSTTIVFLIICFTFYIKKKKIILWSFIYLIFIIGITVMLANNDGETKKKVSDSVITNTTPEKSLVEKKLQSEEPQMEITEELTEENWNELKSMSLESYLPYLDILGEKFKENEEVLNEIENYRKVAEYYGMLNQLMKEEKPLSNLNSFRVDKLLSFEERRKDYSSLLNSGAEEILTIQNSDYARLVNELNVTTENLLKANKGGISLLNNLKNAQGISITNFEKEDVLDAQRYYKEIVSKIFEELETSNIKLANSYEAVNKDFEKIISNAIKVN